MYPGNSRNYFTAVENPTESDLALTLLHIALGSSHMGTSTPGGINHQTDLKQSRYCEGSECHDLPLDQWIVEARRWF